MISADLAGFGLPSGREALLVRTLSGKLHCLDAETLETVSVLFRLGPAPVLPLLALSDAVFAASDVDGRLAVFRSKGIPK
jgi:hypothetical protein